MGDERRISQASKRGREKQVMSQRIFLKELKVCRTVSDKWRFKSQESTCDLLPKTSTTSRLYAVKGGVRSGLSSHGSFKLEEVDEPLD